MNPIPTTKTTAMLAAVAMLATGPLALPATAMAEDIPSTFQSRAAFQPVTVDGLTVDAISADLTGVKDHDAADKGVGVVALALRNTTDKAIRLAERLNVTAGQNGVDLAEGSWDDAHPMPDGVTMLADATIPANTENLTVRLAFQVTNRDAIDVTLKGLDGSTLATQSFTSKTVSEARTKLDQAIAAGQARLADGVEYTEASRTALQTAVTQAQGLAGDATDEACDNARQAIETAVAGLVEQSSADLDAAIGKAEQAERNKAKYTADSWTPVQSALDAARGLGDKATGEQKAQAAQTLEAAFAGLESQAHSDLNERIGQGRALLDSDRDWTDASRTGLETAVTQAEGTLGEPGDLTADAARQAARKALETAIQGMATNAQQKLRDAVKANETRHSNRAKYTQATADPFEAAYADAKAKQNDGTLTDGAYDDARILLETTASALVSKQWDRLDASVTAAQAAFQGQDWTDDTKTVYQTALDAATNALEGDRQDLSLDDARSRAADTLDKAVEGLETKGQKDLRDALKDAKAKSGKQAEKKGEAYAKDSYEAFEQAVSIAEGIQSNKEATDEQRHAAAASVRNAIAGLVVASWKVDGTKLEATADGFAGHIKVDKATATLTATGSDDSTVSLPIAGTMDEHPLLGVTVTTGTFAGGPNISVEAEWTTGREITAGDGKVRFELTDGMWTARLANTTLDESNKPAVDTVRLSDGTTLTFTWAEPTTTRGGNDILYVQRAGVAQGESTGGTARVLMDARRGYQPTAGLTLERTGADGSTQTLPIADAKDVKDLPASIDMPTLAHTLAGDAYRIAVKHGADVTDPTIEHGLEAGGVRTWTVTFPYRAQDGTQASKTIMVRQAFEQAPRQSDNPKAALEGIQVNGRLIDGWDPDVLEYTITAQGDEPYRVTPTPKTGQFVSAGALRQTAYTSVQEWTVSMDGQSRVYRVTVVRPHTEQTADEEFAPEASKDMGGDATAPSESTATLKSIGILGKDGRYVPQESDEFQIPEGSRLAYESYEGQTVVESKERVRGMTWRHTFDVLSPDGATSGTRTVTVTYLTERTHRAELTGIIVDGQPVEGFKPDQREYTVKVNDPNQYVASPRFDKMTGMSVSTVKKGTDSIITVTSADLLRQAEYTVHAERKPSNPLAETGVKAGLTLIAIAILAALGLGGGMLAKRLKARRSGGTGTEPERPSGDTTLEA